MLDNTQLETYRADVSRASKFGFPVKLDEAGSALLAAIEDVFFVWKHGGQTWVQGEMLDNHEDPDLVAAGGRIGQYRRWQDVQPGLLACYPSAGGFLDLDGQLFHLPALMKWNLLFGPTSDVYPADVLERPDVIANLSPHLDPQRLAVYQRYLDYMATYRHASPEEQLTSPGWVPRRENV